MSETPSGVARQGETRPAQPPSPTALAAAQRIRAWHELSTQFTAMIEAQVMEALWIIRREIPDDAAFDGFVKAQTPLVPEQARLKVATWSVARKSRALRELSLARPSEASRLVGDLVRVFDEENVGELDPADQEIVEIASLSLRQQRRRVRALIEAGQAVSEGRHPEDLERIRTLEAELAAARTVVDLDGHPGGQARNLLSDLRAAESDVAEIAARAEALFGGREGLHHKEREGAVRLADMLSESIDRIARLALGESA